MHSFFTFLNVYGCAVRGQAPKELSQTEIQEILLQARKYGCYYIVLDALNCTVQNADADGSAITSIKSITITNYLKYLGKLEFIKELDEHGIPNILLKGISLARYYAKPLLRPSTDIDILIQQSDEERTFEFLRSKGLRLTVPRNEGYHHSLWYSPKFGLLEVHVVWNRKMASDVWFSTKGKIEQRYSLESTRDVQTDDGVYHILGPNSQLLHVFLHAMRHFIQNGVHIQMIMDFLLLYKNETGLNYRWFWETVRALHFDRVAMGFFSIGITHFGFLPTDFEALPSIAPKACEGEMILLDLIKTDSISNKNDDNNFSMLRYERYKERSMGMYKLMIGQLFPSVDFLSKNHVYLRDKPYLYIVAWSQRLFHFTLKHIVMRRSGSKKVTSDECNTREKLFRALHMIAK